MKLPLYTLTIVHDHEIETELFATRDGAEKALLSDLMEMFGEGYFDEMPDTYDESTLSEFVGSIGASYTWNITEQTMLTDSPRTHARGVTHVLELSTGHVPEETAAAIDSGTFPKPILTESEYGWLFSVPELADFPELVDPLPCDAFKAVMRHAAANDCTLVLFDRDGEPLDELELFDW